MLWLRPLQFEQWRSNSWRGSLSCEMFSTVRVSGSGAGARAVLGIFGMIRTLFVIRFRGSGTKSGLVISPLGIIRRLQL